MRMKWLITVGLITSQVMFFFPDLFAHASAILIGAEMLWVWAVK